jgi:hypothetical protein
MLYKLKIDNFPKMNRGMRATQDIFPGDVLVKLPLDMCIVVDASTKKPQDVRVTYENWQNMDYFEKIATIMILEYELGRESKHYVYLRSFQKNMNLIDTWQDVSGKLLRLKNKRIHENMVRLKKFYWCDRDVALYFLDVARSRGIYSKCSCAMYPMLDLFNHDVENTKEFDYDLRREDDVLVFRSTRRVPRGEQFFVSYGALSPDELIYNYGIQTPSSHIDNHFF